MGLKNSNPAKTEDEKVEEAGEKVEAAANPITFSHEQGESEPEVVNEPEVEANDEELPGTFVSYLEGDSARTVDPSTGQAMTVGELRQLEASRNND